jgi:hypothetical protein
MEMKGNTEGHGTLAHSRPFRPPRAFAGGIPPRMPAKETARISYPSGRTDIRIKKGMSQARDFHHHRPPRSPKSAAFSKNTAPLHRRAVHPSRVTFYLRTGTGNGFGRERMVFERFLLPVLLAEGEAGKALGGPAGWRTENERECHAFPSCIAGSRNVGTAGRAG